MAFLLILEDERDLSEAVCEYLSAAGHHTLPAYTCKEALALAENNKIDLGILDIMLPDGSGMDVLRRIRTFSDVPVLMLTALEDEKTQALSFDGLADDYITKPYSMLLLGKRVTALLRRSGKVILPEKVHVGDIEVDFGGYKAEGTHGSVELTPREIDILRLLVEHKGLVLSRGQILDDVWGFDAEVTDRVIDSYVKNLRKKLCTDQIVTVKGVGYKFEEQP